MVRAPQGRCRGAHAGSGDGVDRVRLEVDVVAVERRQVLVGEARALAAEGVSRRQLVAHDGIVHRLTQVAQAHPLTDVRDVEQAVVVGRQGEVDLDEGLADEARHPLGAREAPQGEPDRLGHGRIGLGQAPDRGPLEHGQVFSTTGSIEGMDLHGRIPPVPTIATRLPRRSTSWSHRAVCITVPVKSSSPGMSGGFPAWSAHRWPRRRTAP